MNQGRRGRVKELLRAALEHEPGERASFLNGACAGDEALRAEIESLLADYERARSFLQRPVSLDSATTESVVIAGARFAPGQVLSGRFRVVRFIAYGGMGEVYEAEDLDLGERVALKTVRPEISSDPRSLARFKQEIQLARRVTHPNVCRMFDLERHQPEGEGAAGAVTFLTMELLEGETLSARLRRIGRMTTVQALPLVQQMAEALAAAHEVGVVHRDFKPGNVILVSPKSGERGERAVVTDFGLAKTVASADEASGAGPASALTAPGHMMGTVPYMAPEQIEGGEITPATDVYALGLVIYEMITGARPFASAAALGDAVRRVTQPAPSPRIHVPDLDPRWESVILRCLETNPASRFASAREVVGALDARIPPSGESPSPLWPRLGRWRRAVAISAGGALVLVVLAAALLTIRPDLRRKLFLPPTPAPPRSLLVADFDNHTGNSLFDGTVSEAVAQSLTQSRVLNVVPRSLVVEAAKRTGRADVKRIDAVLGREICVREGYGSLLAGDIVADGAGYRVNVQVVDPRKRSLLLTDAQSLRDEKDLFRGADDLTKRLRRRLGESLAQIQESKPLAQVTTPSLEALQRYSLAVDRYAMRDFEGALALTADAIHYDPNFAMAHLLRARCDEELGNDVESTRELDQARKEIDKVSDRERHLILAMGYAAQVLEEKAADEYRLLLRLYPDDLDGLRGLAKSAYWLGRNEEAVTAQRRALELNPNSAQEYGGLMDLLNRSNSFDEALACYQDSRQHKVEDATLHFGAGLAWWGKGDVERAGHEFTTLRDAGGFFGKIVGQIYLARLLIYQGRLAEAGGAIRTGLAFLRPGGNNDWRATLEYLLAKTELMRGRPAAAAIEARHLAAAASAVYTAENLQMAGEVAIECSDLSLAHQMFTLLSRKRSEDMGAFTALHFYSLKGEIELAEGNSAAAVESQRQAASFYPGYEPLLPLAQACLAREDWPCAVQAYQSYLHMKGEVLRDDFPANWALSHLWLARTLWRQGERHRALGYFDVFLQQWSAADKDLPAFSQAKAEYAKLKTE